MVPIAGGVVSGFFMLMVKSAVFEALASSVTASCTESAVAETTLPGIS